jgi:hypothetical protein
MLRSDAGSRQARPIQVSRWSTRQARHLCRTSKFEAVNFFAEELRETAKYIATRGKGILASDESNATTGKRLATVGVDNTEDNRRAWRECLYTAPGLGQYISGVSHSDLSALPVSARAILPINLGAPEHIRCGHYQRQQEGVA